jgi:uncharacterized protein YndB with AHSA1/START domain
MDRVKFTSEFIFRASPNILYKFLTSPDLLIRWFCDEADINGREFTFSWEGAEEYATLIENIEDSLIRMQWEDADSSEYLEYKMSRSPVTGETILHITDFCDEDEVEGQKQLWETQIQRLKSATGG